jgi:hypothetical protein
MREKLEQGAQTEGLFEVDPEKVRSDLEERGIDPKFSGPVARRLVAIAPDLSGAEYAAILDGVLAAYGVHRESAALADAAYKDANELRRLVEGFQGELRKLDEGLQLLSAYVVRMGAIATCEGSESLH